jgi:hypothetical protein
MAKFFLLTALLLSTRAAAWDVAYYDDTQCRSAQTGFGSYTQITPEGLCINVNFPNTVSATVSNKLNGQNVIIFLAESNCGGSILGSADSDRCVEFSTDGFASVLIK